MGPVSVSVNQNKSICYKLSVTVSTSTNELVCLGHLGGGFVGMRWCTPPEPEVEANRDVVLSRVGPACAGNTNRTRLVTF